MKYLSKVRPKAMEHLLSFFAESARQLDPRTRFLISIVTKVISHSQRGVEQYVRRALEEGASPDEILDAILCAYPCAGLTRVVDAVDTVLDMGLPGFAPEALGVAPEEAPREAPAPAADWVEAAELERLPAVGGLCVVVRGRGLAIFRDGEAIRAIDDCCPHKGASLSEGIAVGGEVECPRHHWRFHLADGRCTTQPRAAVRAYATRVEGQKILVQLPR